MAAPLRKTGRNEDLVVVFSLPVAAAAAEDKIMLAETEAMVFWSCVSKVVGIGSL